MTSRGGDVVIVHYAVQSQVCLQLLLLQNHRCTNSFAMSVFGIVVCDPCIRLTVFHRQTLEIYIYGHGLCIIC